MFGLNIFKNYGMKSVDTFGEKSGSHRDKIRPITVDDLDEILIVLQTSFQSENAKDYLTIDEDPLANPSHQWAEKAVDFNQRLRSLIIILKNERRKMSDKILEESLNKFKKSWPNMEHLSP